MLRKSAVFSAADRAYRLFGAGSLTALMSLVAYLSAAAVYTFVPMSVFVCYPLIRSLMGVCVRLTANIGRIDRRLCRRRLTRAM